MSDEDVPGPPPDTSDTDEPAANAATDEPADVEAAPADEAEAPVDEAAPATPSWFQRRRVAMAAVAGVLVVGTAGVVVAAGGGGSCPSGDAIVEVDGSRITAEQLQRRAEVVEALYGLKAPEGEKADPYRRELAKSMATALVVEQQAEERKVVVADRAVRDALDRYIADFFPSGGRDQFIEAMGNKGVSEAEVLGEFRQIQTTFRLLDTVTTGITVTDAEVAAAYEKRKAELVLPERRKLRHLVVATREEANAALGRVRSGEAFAAVATAVTLDSSTKDQGGDLGARAPSDLEGAFGQAAFAAAVGQPFGPVQTRFGWHVGIVEEVLPSRPLTEEEATAALKEQLLAERKLAAQRAYTARILKEADVCYDAGFRPADPTAPPPETSPAPEGATTTSR